MKLAVDRFHPLTEREVERLEGAACELCDQAFRPGDVTAPLPVEEPAPEATQVACVVCHLACLERAEREAAEAEARFYFGLVQ